MNCLRDAALVHSTAIHLIIPTALLWFIRARCRWFINSARGPNAAPALVILHAVPDNIPTALSFMEVFAPK